METHDSSADMPERFQLIMDTLEEKLQQCNNVIELHKSFDEKQKENLDFIGLQEQFINKYYSYSLDPAVQLEKCTVSDCISFDECLCSLHIYTTGIKGEKNEEQHKHDIMLEEGRKMSELSYVDVDKNHTSKLNQIAEKWKALWVRCDEWYEVVTSSDIKKQEDKSEVSCALLLLNCIK